MCNQSKVLIRIKLISQTEYSFSFNEHGYYLLREAYVKFILAFTDFCIGWISNQRSNNDSLFHYNWVVLTIIASGYINKVQYQFNLNVVTLIQKASIYHRISLRQLGFDSRKRFQNFLVRYQVCLCLLQHIRRFR